MIAEIETIDEQIEEQPNLASGMHGEIATTITGYLFIYLLNNNRGRLFDGRTTFELDPKLPKREPDVSFVKLERLPQTIDDTLHLAPDLAVEVISSHDDWKDIVKKAVSYLKLRVSLVWVIDPYTQAVFVFTPEKGHAFDTLRDSQELDGGTLLPGFKLKVADIFRRVGTLDITDGAI